MIYFFKCSYFIMYIEYCYEFQVWNLDEVVKLMNMLDKLIGVIVDIQFMQDGEIVYVMCKCSDEIGVIEMKIGIMVDFFIYDSFVVDFVIIFSGGYVFVFLELRKKDISIKLWNLKEC